MHHYVCELTHVPDLLPAVQAGDPPKEAQRGFETEPTLTSLPTDGEKGPGQRVLL